MKVAETGLAVDALLPGFARIDKASPGFALMVDGGKAVVPALTLDARGQHTVPPETLPIAASAANARGVALLPGVEVPTDISPSLPPQTAAAAEPRTRRAMLPELMTGASLLTSAASDKAVVAAPAPATKVEASENAIAATPDPAIATPALPASMAKAQSPAEKPVAPKDDAIVADAIGQMPVQPVSVEPPAKAPEQTDALKAVAEPNAPDAAIPTAPAQTADDATLPSSDEAQQPQSTEKAKAPAAAAGEKPAEKASLDPVFSAEDTPSPAAAVIAPAPQPQTAEATQIARETAPIAPARASAVATPDANPGSSASVNDTREPSAATAFQPDTGTDGQNGSDDGSPRRNPIAQEATTGNERAAMPQQPAHESRAPGAAPMPDRGPAPPTPAMASAASPATAAPVATPAPKGEIDIDARSGSVGRDLGIAIAHKAKNGEDTLRVRMTPGDLGRVEVTLAFDDKGNVQATLKAENHHALDLLRRDAAELGRALDQAGVRADTQSFRFESRSDGNQQQMMNQQGNGGNGGQPRPGTAPLPADEGDFADSDAGYRPIRSDGRVDLIA